LLKGIIQKFKTEKHRPKLGAAEIFKYIGPGLLITVGFIDPGNWASNVAAGSEYGYTLLWMVTLSTIMLVILQHNVAHLGIVTGSCLAEMTSKSLNRWVSTSILSTAVLASVATALAEIMGGAIALNLLFKLPVQIGAVLILALVLWMLLTNSYRKLEKWIIGFVSLIGISFIFELSLVKVDWTAALGGWVTPVFPAGSMPVIMAVLGAVVMPHNLFLHSEIIQSRQWNKTDETVIKRQLKYEFLDTLFSMGVGWAINSAMIILAAAAFFAGGIHVGELGQAEHILEPLLGKASAVIFALALLFSGISSSTTAGMAAGSIFAGIFGESYDIKDFHSKFGVIATLTVATVAIFLISDPFKALIYSQMLLSIQLPITVFLQLYLTSSGKIMGKYRNSIKDTVMIGVTAAIITVLNVLLFRSFIFK
jgi:manganese transport protein